MAVCFAVRTDRLEPWYFALTPIKYRTLPTDIYFLPALCGGLAQATGFPFQR